MKILVVEDDYQLASVAYKALTQNGYEVDLASTGEIAIEHASSVYYDCILLDINLPELSGFEVCQILRKNSITSPIIILTSRDDQEDVIHGLKNGADDYITKPYSIEVLLARIESSIRRQGSYSVDHTLEFDSLKIDPDARRAWRGNDELDLSKKEFDLLHYMLINSENALSRDKILSRVWGENSEHTNNIIDVYVGYLRKKIDYEPHKKILHTIRGFGYTLKLEE